jgi:hypothetical protein
MMDKMVFGQYEEELGKGAYQEGLKHKGMYIRDIEVPSWLFSQSDKVIHYYLKGIFSYTRPKHEYTFCYSTNLPFMESLQKLMKKVGIETEIYPFENIECKYGIKVI